MHDRFADWLSLFSKKGREQIVTIFSGIVGERDVGDLGCHSHKVCQTAKLLADRTGLDLTGPARDERNAMTCIPDVGLLTAPVCIRAMGVARLVSRLPIRSVIAGEDHQSV